jgi:hypothetical protein
MRPPRITQAPVATVTAAEGRVEIQLDLDRPLRQIEVKELHQLCSSGQGASLVHGLDTSERTLTFHTATPYDPRSLTWLVEAMTKATSKGDEADEHNADVQRNIDTWYEQYSQGQQSNHTVT